MAISVTIEWEHDQDGWSAIEAFYGHYTDSPRNDHFAFDRKEGKLLTPVKKDGYRRTFAETNKRNTDYTRSMRYIDLIRSYYGKHGVEYGLQDVKMMEDINDETDGIYFVKAKVYFNDAEIASEGMGSIILWPDDPRPFMTEVLDEARGEAIKWLIENVVAAKREAAIQELNSIAVTPKTPGDWLSLVHHTIALEPTAEAV